MSQEILQKMSQFESRLLDGIDSTPSQQNASRRIFNPELLTPKSLQQILHPYEGYTFPNEEAHFQAKSKEYLSSLTSLVLPSKDYLPPPLKYDDPHSINIQIHMAPPRPHKGRNQFPKFDSPLFRTSKPNVELIPHTKYHPPTQEYHPAPINYKNKELGPQHHHPGSKVQLKISTASEESNTQEAQIQPPRKEYLPPPHPQLHPSQEYLPPPHLSQEYVTTPLPLPPRQEYLPPPPLPPSHHHLYRIQARNIYHCLQVKNIYYPRHLLQYLQARNIYRRLQIHLNFHTKSTMTTTIT